MILYKKDVKNKIRTLEITSVGDEVIQESGLIHGAKVRRASKCIGKNIGKANATTPQEQAEIEAQSKITKKLKEGYFLTLDQATNNVVVLPMLAHSWKDHQHKIDRTRNRVFIQPKYDGMRCLAIFNDNHTVTLKSRSGNEIKNMDHIKNALTSLTDHEVNNCMKNVILDGELYVHGENFQTNMKYIKKYRKGKSERISLYLYDMVLQLPFAHRYMNLLEVFNNYFSKAISIKLTKSASLGQNFSDKDLNLMHQENLALGYEGSILRWGDDFYQFDKRSSSILKYKDFIDETYKVHDVIPSEKDPSVGVVHCIDDLGNTFGCGMKFSYQEKEEILANKYEYIGQTAEVRFFEFSEDGIPRFPVCVGFRLDK